MAVAMMLGCMSSLAQDERVKEFQELVSKYETPYRDFRGIDMNSDPGSAYHYSMADTSGRSVAVEFLN